MANDLSFQLEGNEILWQRWLEFGVTPGDNFEIEFHFSAAREDAANALITGLEKTGLVARKKARRKFFVLKDWFVTVPVSQSWTLESLNNQTRQFCKLADILHLVFDGCGAYMPSRVPIVKNKSL